MKGFIQSRYSVTMWLLYIATLLTVVVGGRYQHTSRPGFPGLADHPVIMLIGGDHAFAMIWISICISVCMGVCVLMYFFTLGDRVGDVKHSNFISQVVSLLGIPAAAAVIAVMTNLTWEFGFSILSLMVSLVSVGFAMFFNAADIKNRHEDEHRSSSAA